MKISISVKPTEINLKKKRKLGLFISEHKDNQKHSKDEKAT